MKCLLKLDHIHCMIVVGGIGRTYSLLLELNDPSQIRNVRMMILNSLYPLLCNKLLELLGFNSPWSGLFFMKRWIITCVGINYIEDERSQN